MSQWFSENGTQASHGDSYGPSSLTASMAT